MKIDREEHTLWIDCACDTPRDAVRFKLYKNEPLEDPELYLSTMLEQLPWWRRIVPALKYLFTGTYIHSETIFTRESVEELVKLLTVYKVLLKVRDAKRNRLKESENKEEA